MSTPLRSTPRPGGYSDLDPQEAHKNLGALRIVDVREPHEFNDALGHVAGATLAPLGSIPGALRDWDHDSALLVICRSGGRSARASIALAQAGFGQVYNLAGGMMGWNAAGLPVLRG